MATSLNIRDIGAERKAKLEAEAKARGVPVAEIVRTLLDDGLDKAARKRAQEEWIEAARPGLEAERAMYEKHGPTLARYRTFSR
ncbi:MAG: type II toxin-antitoxin system CcdA family antitoxin [Pseudomonadota bacterium]